jgi:hypothetical protein
MLDVFDHFSGSLVLTPEEGFETGPRKPGHSGSAAKAQASREKKSTEATAVFMILLDYKSR